MIHALGHIRSLLKVSKVKIDRSNIMSINCAKYPTKYKRKQHNVDPNARPSQKGESKTRKYYKK